MAAPNSSAARWSNGKPFLSEGRATPFVKPSRGPAEAQPPIAGTLTQLTSQAGQELFPSLSPDGDIVVYAGAASGNWDIYRQRVGGETAFNLTEDSMYDDTQPAFSPDGELIAFRSERDGGGIFIMGATGESVRRLTDFGHNPAWSPDGDEIAVATEGPVYVSRANVSQLWAVEVGSAEKRLITEGDAVQPSWSPSGARIAYWKAVPDGRWEISTLPAMGGEPVPVTNDADTDWSPVWSPDGNHLYFSSDRGGSMNLWRVPLDETSGNVTGAPEPVTTGAAASRAHFSFSKDGRFLAYVERVRLTNIWRVGFDPATSTPEGAPVPITRGSKSFGNPDVSPDGNWLAYQSLVRQPNIFVMRTDGTGRRQLTDGPYRDLVPRWSPDGERIAFYSDRTRTREIWSVRPDGSGLQQLTETPGHHIYYFAWSPDGARMAYYNNTTGGSFIVRLDEPQSPAELPAFNEGAARFWVYRWSPDGQKLAGWTRADDRTNRGVVVYSLESGKYQRVTDSGGYPVWLSDSRRLLYFDDGVKLVDSGSGRVHEVLTDVDFNFSISRDDRTLYFGRIVEEADIWLLTLGRGKSP